MKRMFLITTGDDNEVQETVYEDMLESSVIDIASYIIKNDEELDSLRVWELTPITCVSSGVTIKGIKELLSKRKVTK